MLKEVTLQVIQSVMLLSIVLHFHFAPKVNKRESCLKLRMTAITVCCLAFHQCKQSGTCHIFVNVKSFGMQFSQGNLEGGTGYEWETSGSGPKLLC